MSCCESLEKLGNPTEGLIAQLPRAAVMLLFCTGPESPGPDGANVNDGVERGRQETRQGDVL